MLMKFSLSTEITYKDDDFDITAIGEEKEGFEACIYMKYSLDGLAPEFAEIWKGTREPLTDIEKEIFNSGLPVPPRDDEKLFLPTGSYTMVQLPAAEDKRALRRSLLPYATERGEGYVYVRFFRENSLTVMQFFFPSEN